MGISKSRKRTPSPRDGDSRVTWRLIRSLVSITRANASSWCSPNLERRCGCPSNTHSSRDTGPGPARGGAQVRSGTNRCRMSVQQKGCQGTSTSPVSDPSRCHRPLPTASRSGAGCISGWQSCRTGSMPIHMARCWLHLLSLLEIYWNCGQRFIGHRSKLEPRVLDIHGWRGSSMSEAATELRLLDACRSWNMELERRRPSDDRLTVRNKSRS
jgi:hypothetical protein